MYRDAVSEMSLLEERKKEREREKEGSKRKSLFLCACANTAPANGDENVYVLLSAMTTREFSRQAERKKLPYIDTTSREVNERAERSRVCVSN